jgi:predicted DNA-binding ribbon-helix-helix protein
MQSGIRKRSIIVNGHNTSVTLEDGFWSSLKEISKVRRSTLSETVTEVDRTRTQGNLSSALRLFVLDFYRSAGTSSARDLSDRARAAGS